MSSAGLCPGTKHCSSLPFPLCHRDPGRVLTRAEAGIQLPGLRELRILMLSQCHCEKQQAGGQGQALPCCEGSDTWHSTWESLSGCLPSVLCWSLVLHCSIYDPAEEPGGTVATGCTGLPAPLALPPHSFLSSHSAL